MTTTMKAAWLVIAAYGICLTQANASNVSVSSSFDRSSNEVEVVLAIDPPPHTAGNLKFSLDYSSDQATFTKAMFPNANVNSYASSKAGNTGQVNGSAVVDFTKGRTAVKLYFSTQGSGELTGVFQSVTVNGENMGPVKLPPVSFNQSALSNPATEQVAASNIILNGMNHALAVHWSHPGDGVTGFRANVWVLQSSGQLTGPVASCDATGAERTCVISGLRNGRIYRTVVGALYPDGAPLMSSPSDPAIPFATNLNGRCLLRTLPTPPEKMLGSRQMCLAGRVTAYIHDGLTSKWMCVGLGNGDTQTCGSP